MVSRLLDLLESLHHKWDNHLPLIVADFELQRARINLQNLESLLEPTGVPTYFWPAKILNLYARYPPRGFPADGRGKNPQHRLTIPSTHPQTRKECVYTNWHPRCSRPGLSALDAAGLAFTGGASSGAPPGAGMGDMSRQEARA
jgi:hypothetical protein